MAERAAPLQYPSGHAIAAQGIPGAWVGFRTAAGCLEFLDAVYTLNLDCNLHYEDQLAHLIQVLNNIGVRPVLLKGAAALVSGLYPTPGERMTGDIDILIPASRLPGVFKHLCAAGYQQLEAEEELPKAGAYGRNRSPSLG